MKTAAIRWLPIALLALAATPAASLEVSGAVGGGWTRSDTWAADTHAAQGAWDLNLSFSLGTEIFDPNLATLSLGADYSGYRSLYYQPAHRADNWHYRANLSLLSATDFPVSISASRFTSDLKTDGENFRTGSTEITTLGGATAVHVYGLPYLTLTANRTWATTHSPGVPDNSTDTTALSASAGQAVQTYSWNASYNTTFNTGTRSEYEYQTHDLVAEASVNLTSNLDLRLRERYMLREPRAESPLSPRLSGLDSSAGLSWRTARTTSMIGYGYSRSLGEFVGAPAQEEVGHTLSYSIQYPYGSALTLTGSAGLGMAMARLGTQEERGYGQQIGANVSWQGPTRGVKLNIQGGFNVGASEPSTGGTQGAWGINAGVTATTVLGGWDSSGNYRFDYSRGLGGVDGSALSQGLNLATRAPWRWAAVDGQIRISASRRDSALLGTTVSRSISMIVNGRRERVSLGLSAAFLDGFGPSLQIGTVTEGLFLPASFTSHSWYLSLNGSFLLARNLSLVAGAQYAQATAAGQATQTDRGLSVGAGYTLGEFQFTLDDRVANGGVGSLTQTVNVVMLRASRAFGASF